eukprot:COSAG06_NODE_244_length_19215_cov_20.256853_9_plen_87_part_00
MLVRLQRSANTRYVFQPANVSRGGLRRCSTHTTTLTLTGHLHNFGLPGVFRTNPTLTMSCLASSIGRSSQLAAETECRSRKQNGIR